MPPRRARTQGRGRAGRKPCDVDIHAIPSFDLEVDDSQEKVIEHLASDGITPESRNNVSSSTSIYNATEIQLIYPISEIDIPYDHDQIVSVDEEN